MPDIHNQPAITSSIDRQRGSRLGGLVIIVASCLAIFLMLHHPSPNSHDFSDFVDEVRHLQLLNVIVHASAIVAMILFVFGFSWLSTCLGFDRSSVRLAMITYTLGALGMIAAAMVSGFIVPHLLERYHEASTSEVETATQMMGMLREVNRAFDQLGVVAMSVGVTLWSLAMLCQKHRAWTAGILGIVVGVAGVVGMLTGHLSATVHGMITFVVLQGVWNITVGILMMRGTLISDGN